MAEFLTQEEINSLLDVIEDTKREEGSPEFEKLYAEYKDFKDSILVETNIFEVSEMNPERILDRLDKIDKHLKEIEKAKETFDKLYKKFKHLEKTQPEILL